MVNYVVEPKRGVDTGRIVVDVVVENYEDVPRLTTCYVV